VILTGVSLVALPLLALVLPYGKRPIEKSCLLASVDLMVSVAPRLMSAQLIP